MKKAGALGLLCAITAMLPCSATGQERPEGAGTPILLKSTEIGADARSLIFDGLEPRGRITAIRLEINSGSCTVQRVVVSYKNGQIHFEDRDIALNERGRRSALIDPRVESRLIEQVQVQLKQGTCATGIVLALQGMQPDAARAEVEGKQPAQQPRMTSARRQRGLATEGALPPPVASRGTPTEARPEAASAAQEKKKFTEVAVFYGTSRELGPQRKRDDVTMASFGPSPNPDGKMTLGRSVVTVPNQGRDPGEINRPQLSIFSLGYEKEDLERHFTIYRVDMMNEAEFKAAAQISRKSEGSRFKDHAFVFVHGYNVSFDDALFRGAQLAFDMQFDGLPFVFSWPSRSNAAGYILDKDRAFDARHALHDFIEIVRQVMGSHVKNIHFIGHSMGSLPLMEALATYDSAATSGPLFGQVIFAASDVVPETFKMATGRIAKAASGVTLYASNNDWALTISKAFRLGVAPVGFVASGSTPFMTAGIDSVDVSALDTTFWARNHSTYGDRRPLIEDMSKLFGDMQYRPPSKRDPNFREHVVPSAGSVYWQYLK